jgi:adenine-specific DNA-methyltransferase
MNYIGSKKTLLSFIEETIENNIEGKLQDKIFCDLFAGTGIVGTYFKNKAKSVISNDLEYYSYILNKNYVGINKILDLENIFQYLNELPLKEGFIYKHYCQNKDSERMYFSLHNGKKVDTIRKGIQDLYDRNLIDEESFYHLLASLIESADKVANTASVYGAYLKHIKKSALKELILKPAEFEISSYKNQVFNMDANYLIEMIEGDILYLDPPYNARQYSANYHLLNTIAEYKEFIPKGKTGLREYNKSNYSKKTEVLNSFEELIKHAKFKYIFLSYNNEGLMTVDDIRRIMSKFGEYSLEQKEYKRFKADKTENRNHKDIVTYEMIHILKKED